MYVKVYVPLTLGSLGTCIHEEFFFLGCLCLQHLLTLISLSYRVVSEFYNN